MKRLKICIENEKVATVGKLVINNEQAFLNMCTFHFS